MELNENSIYALPDGRELIARSGTHGGYFLHDRLGGSMTAPVYLVDKSGQILSWGRVTRWTIKDLRETRTVSQPQLQQIRVVS
jgi:hypothetical protein